MPSMSKMCRISNPENSISDNLLRQVVTMQLEKMPGFFLKKWLMALRLKKPDLLTLFPKIIIRGSG
jgi:hypothetical protein